MSHKQAFKLQATLYPRSFLPLHHTQSIPTHRLRILLQTLQIPQHGSTFHRTLRTLKESISRQVDYGHSVHTLLNQPLQVAQGLSYVANLPFERRYLPSEGSTNICEWTENGAICGHKITRANLPEHLSVHGIKNKSRNSPTTCHWAGCKKRAPMNRESIVRHIREVHLRLKRPTKRV